MVPFTSHRRVAFNGMALVIVRSDVQNAGTITIMAKSPGLKDAKVKIKSKLMPVIN
jgi:beta-galactosidase